MAIERPVKTFDFNKVQVAPAYEVERQFDNHRRSIDQIIRELSKLLRSDGKLNSDLLAIESFPREILAETVSAALVEIEQVKGGIHDLLNQIAARQQAIEAGAGELRALIHRVFADNQATRNLAVEVQTGQRALADNYEPLMRQTASQLSAAANFDEDEAGAEATAEDWAEVSIEWAEHMPDTIPPNILATNAITGDHWSSRWWANRAAQIVSGLVPLPSGIAPMTEALSITGTNAVADLQHAPYGAVTLFYNGQAFTSLDLAPAFTVAGQTIHWSSTTWSLIPGQSLVAQYFYATGG